ncbi:MAG: transporter substrate-binding domain-containing protein [Thermoanaerobaculia bacterium]|nr:transporter substrate-binding domain-containing protein [Thermoanaerobaculia bacterium]
MSTARLLALALLLATTWLPQARAADDTLRVCARQTPPFLFDDDGNLTGFEHDLLVAFAERHSLRLEWIRPEHFADIFHFLLEGRCDLGAATITRTAERESQFAFSDSYFPVRILLVEPHGQFTARAPKISLERPLSRSRTVPGRVC